MQKYRSIRLIIEIKVNVALCLLGIAIIIQTLT